MSTEIFKLFKKSIEQVKVKKTKRGTMDDTQLYEVTVDAIIKRRDGMDEAVENSEDRNTQTTIHFRRTDGLYIEDGNFVEIDGLWRVIERHVDGKDFGMGKSSFIKAYIGNQIQGGSSDPEWS